MVCFYLNLEWPKQLLSNWKFAIFTYVFIYLFIYSLEQSPSWEANRFSSSQDIPRILWGVSLLPHVQVPATCP